MSVETRERELALDAPEPSARVRQLAARLRTLASEAAEQVDGGVALIFVAAPGAEPTLRAAAGFRTAEAARRAADALAESVRAALGKGEPARLPCPPGFANPAPAELLFHPAGGCGQLQGALVVGAQGPVDGAQEAQLGRHAELAGIHLDNAQLAEQLEQAHRLLDETRGHTDEKSEEILKLSEALFAQDIELLRKDEKLGKVEKLKNDFIEKMSRELRTPLNSIIETIISVLTGENDALSDAAKSALRSALDDGTAFLRTLENILDLWKIKQGELGVEIQEVNFRELVDEAIFSIQDELDGKDLSVEPQIHEPFPKIRTDLTKLNQILFLLLENAVRFTPKGRVEIRARVEDEKLICDVEDTGIGICPDDQQFLFDEFFQVDGTSSDRYGGAGLGLALVRDLLVLLDGEIAVSSDVGRGTTMTFQVPVQVG